MSFLVTEKTELICDVISHATVGEDVTLNCFHMSLQNMKGESVVWTLNTTVRVLVFKSSGLSVVDQDGQFKGRASLGVGWDPDKGKLPVELSRVTEADGGTYNCSVGSGTQKRSCSTQLHIYQSNDILLNRL